MNLREGRIGIQEGVCLCVTAMSISGLFTLDPYETYSKGNTGYITLPLAIAVSLLVFLLTMAVMKRTNMENLSDLMEGALGRSGAGIASTIMLMSFILAAYVPLASFTQAMHALFYNGAEYGKILLFIIPAVTIMAWLGFETLGRAAKCFSWILIAVTALSILGASSEFETYRLYPLMAGGLMHNSKLVICQTTVFLPAMAAALITTKGLNGISSAKRVGIRSAVIAMAICFVTQLAEGLTFEYDELSELFMPLYKINHLNLMENRLLRVDKIAQMAWLNGCILTASFYLYAGSSAFCRGFGIKDIRPSLAAASIITIAAILLEFSGAFSGMHEVKMVISLTGGVIITLVVVVSSLLVLLKERKRTAE